jgi:hypothetical protein
MEAIGSIQCDARAREEKYSKERLGNQRQLAFIIVLHNRAERMRKVGEIGGIVSSVNTADRIT